MNKKHYFLSLLLILAYTLSACNLAGEPRLIIITPTPGDATITPLPTTTPTITPSPTVTASPAATATPSATLRGAIVDENYVLPTFPPAATTPIPATPAPSDAATDPIPPAPPAETPQQTITLPEREAYLNPWLIGFQVDDFLEYNQWEHLVGQVDAIGVRWIKIQVNWAEMQPQAPNTFEQRFWLFEHQILAAARPGINVLLSIAKAPNWARSTTEESGPPDDPQALADFITYLFTQTRVGSNIHAIEIWNEPNLAREWRGTLPFSGAGYMQLFRPAYDAIRRHAPDMPIIAAGLAPTGDTPDSINDRLFLQQMYDAGLGRYTDIHIGSHPYSWGNSPEARCCDAIDGRGWDDNPHFFFSENLDATRQIMDDNGHQNAQIWITEIGWATWDGLPGDPPEAWMTYNSPQDQMDYTLRMLELMQQRDDIGPVMIWNLNFATQQRVEQRDEIAAYSLLNPMMFPSERPLYWGLMRAIVR